MERLSVRIRPETARKVRRYKDRKAVTTTEAVRRAVALLNLVERELADGAEVLLKSRADGSVREVWML